MLAVAEAGSNQWAQLLSAIAQLLWPVVALVLVCLFSSELKLIFRRISESRNLKVKWGDKELSIQEAADSIQKVVGSLLDTEAARGPGQNKGILADGAQTGSLTVGPGARADVLPQNDQLAGVAKVAAASLPRRILWVDDRQEGNALEMARLKDRGIQIDEALTTEDALRLFEPGRYALVITDMFRRENGRANAHAGIDLLEQLRAIDPTVAVIAYCAARSVSGYGSSFLRAGGKAITASPVQLFELLNQYLPKIW